MRIAIISDIHGNFDALSALHETYDELWVLGDLVNYGPEPDAVIDFVRSKAAIVIRGNHDHSIGFGGDPRCSPRFREMAEATGRFTEAVLSHYDRMFLRGLPVKEEVRRGDTHFYLCHAVPSDPVFGYCEAESTRWFSEIQNIAADTVLVGHTHVPAMRPIGDCVIINPGSLGQPKTGNAEACYAVWEDGTTELKSYAYPVEKTVAKIKRLPIPSDLQDELITMLRTGSIPPAGTGG